ncbi:MAG TPA: GNAT family N-acetyltransferase [Solirubrobacteraceae bacterium]
MAVAIRTVERSELLAWQAVLDVGFHQASLAPERAEAVAEDFAQEVEWPRIQGAFDDGRVVATFRSFATRLTVPGGEVASAAITNVTVSPTHRRRGLLSRMMAGDLAAARQRGEPVAILIASEWPIYGRYGFGPAADIVNFEVDALSAGFAREGDGETRLVEPAELAAAGPAVYEAHRRSTPGAIERPERWWRQRTGVDPVRREPPVTQRCALALDAGGAPAGLLVYHVDEGWDDWRPRAKLHVRDLFGATPAAEARLWRFACEVDLVATVHADERSVDEPLPWLLRDARAVRQRLKTDFLWARVLDVPAALAARRYLREGELVLEVRDAAGLAAGRFALRGGPDGAECEPTAAAAEVELDVGALSAAYLGGRSLLTLAAAGWAQELRPGALARADAMLHSPVAPWCATMF